MHETLVDRRDEIRQDLGFSIFDWSMRSRFEDLSPLSCPTGSNVTSISVLFSRNDRSIPRRVLSMQIVVGVALVKQIVDDEVPLS